MRKPYFRKDRGAWYVKSSNGKTQIRLDADEKRAFDIWREIVNADNPGAAMAPFASLADNYLKHAKIGQSQLDRTGYYLADFCTVHPATPARQIKPHDLTKWVASHGTARRRRFPRQAPRARPE